MYNVDMICTNGRCELGPNGLFKKKNKEPENDDNL